MKKFANKHYSTMAVSDVLSYLDSSLGGLTGESAQDRLTTFGKNELPQDRRRSWILLFLRQFHSPLVYIILVTAVISVGIGHFSDAGFIFIVILINTIVGFLQENKAERALEALKNSIARSAVVLRAGQPSEIDVSEIVVGDVVQVTAGDYIAADGRMIQCDGLSTNESVLTGESISVKKNTDTLSEEMSIGDRKNMVFAGSYIAEGEGLYIVTETGIDTELGKIASLVRDQDTAEEPLQKEFRTLSRIIGMSVLVAIAFFAVLGIYRGQALQDVFITSTALVVSAIPEGLLPAVTMVMVFGVRRLATKKALVRRLSSTETIGAITTICTDKTGTLTEGEMRVRYVIGHGGAVHELTGHNPAGEQGLLETPKDSHETLRVSAIVNDAFLEKQSTDNKDREITVRGRSTDQALLGTSLVYDVGRDDFLVEHDLVSKIVFSSERKFACRVYQHHRDDTVRISAIGAPERILERVSGILHEGGPCLRNGFSRGNQNTRVIHRADYERLACPGVCVAYYSARRKALTIL